MQGNFHVVVMLVAFAIIEIAKVYTKKAAFNLIQITSETELWIKIPIYIATILGIYNLFLLAIDFLFGEFKFFWEFVEKFFSLFLFRRK